MLKELHILLAQQACVILHIYFFSVSTLNNTVPTAADNTRWGYYYPQYKLMPGTKFNHLGGVKCVARDITPYKSNLRKSDQLPTFSCQWDPNPQPQDYWTHALPICATKPQNEHLICDSSYFETDKSPLSVFTYILKALWIYNHLIVNRGQFWFPGSMRNTY